MPWEWSKRDEKGLARYVIQGAVTKLILPSNRGDLAAHSEGRRLLVRDIYEALSNKGIRYVPEDYDPTDTIQPIRTPDEILDAPREGTCLDLAVLFCGLCLGSGLLPLLIVLDGHALAAVSLKCGEPDWDSITRRERGWFEKDPLLDPVKLRDLIDSGEYIAVECTGFAQSQSLPSSVPEGEGRVGNGLLPFDKAVAAGRRQLDRADRPLQYALDIAVAHYHWKLAPIAGGELDWGAYKIYRDYRRRFREAVQRELPEPDRDFNLTFDLEGEKAVAIASLTDKVDYEKPLILQGYAGGGKSALLRKCANLLLERGFIPVVINLKKWKTPEYSEALSKAFEQDKDIDQKFDVLLNASVTVLNRNMLNALPPQFPKFVMVDGLNEVYGKETTSEILRALDEYVQGKAPDVSVLVTDRKVQRELKRTRWKTAELNLLEPEEVRRHITHQFGDGAYEELSDTEKELFGVPYFLDYAITSNSLHIGSAAEALETFFKNSFFLVQEEFDEAGLNKLAKAAFDAYTEYKSPSFNAGKFRQAVGEDIWRRLSDSGVLKLDDGQARFDHQLKHDYLASRHLARHKDIWDSSSFDAVTFESKTFEPLLMALEQLSDSAQGDEFLKKLYDWNWVATVMSLAKSVKSDRKLFSEEMKIIVLAVIAEKLFDPIRPTRERARIHLSEFPSDVSGPFAQAEDVTDIFKLVNDFKSEVKWFSDWRTIFTRYDSPPLGEQEIALISCVDPIMGWTAANVIRRFKLTEPDLRQLRAVYDAFDSPPETTTRRGEAVQWRVVHAVGTSPTKENVSLLFRALDGRGYHWAKFGAVRSLVEIAAITEDDSLRVQIIEGLKERVDGLTLKVLEEIGSAVFYRDAPATWPELIVPLLNKARDSRQLQTDRETMDNFLSEFRAFVEEGRK